MKETELKLLRSQINPHFLFNSLNSVSSLTITDPEKARDMVIKLSDFMRYALSKKDEQPVSLRSIPRISDCTLKSKRYDSATDFQRRKT